MLTLSLMLGMPELAGA